MTQANVLLKTKAELDLIASLVRQAFEAAGITISRLKVSNDVTPHQVSAHVKGKVRIQRTAYNWELLFDIKESKIVFVSYEGPGTEMGLLAQAEMTFKTRRHDIASEVMRKRIENHDAKIERLIEGQREILNTVSIFNKTVSAAMAAFTVKLREQFRTQLPDPISATTAKQ